MSKVRDKAKGIREGLEDGENNTDGVKEQKSKSIYTDKSKDIKEEKKKRSFMLPVGDIEKIYLLKGKNPDKTLSEIVSEAIKEYYKLKTEEA